MTCRDPRHAVITDLLGKGLDIPEVALISSHRYWRELKRYPQLTAAHAKPIKPFATFVSPTC